MQDRGYAGDANRITRDYLDSLLIEMRHIGARLPDTRYTLFGERFSTPVATAALSHLKGRDGNGMVQTAQGCAMCGAVCFAGMGDPRELGAMIDTGARVIKIIKPYAEREKILRRLEHARQAGALAVGMDLDHTFDAQGNCDVVLGVPMAPLSEDELREVIRLAGLPFFFKGVLSTADTRKALSLGARGIVVSHHHGILPFALPPLMVLPDIVKEAQGRLSIYVDCGIRDGYDVFKALALGADGVCVGRALMQPLQEEGAKGVEMTLRRITAELAGAMARTACATLDDLEPGLVWLP